MFSAMGLNDTDMLVLTVGSHSLGGAFRGNVQPMLPVFQANPRSTFAQFDSTPGTFDNAIFREILANPNGCVLPIDCAIATSPNLVSLTQLFASDQNAFFQAYGASFQRMAMLTSRADWTEAVTFKI
jgi:catalase (peroxidase I)